jgi:hypothetical protein
MSHDAESVDRLLIQLAQLRAELALARAVCDQLQQALHDERARAAALRSRVWRLRFMKMSVRRSRPPREMLY